MMRYVSMIIKQTVTFGIMEVVRYGTMSNQRVCLQSLSTYCPMTAMPRNQPRSGDSPEGARGLDLRRSSSLLARQQARRSPPKMMTMKTGTPTYKERWNRVGVIACLFEVLNSSV